MQRLDIISLAAHLEIPVEPVGGEFGLDRLPDQPSNRLIDGAVHNQAIGLLHSSDIRPGLVIEDASGGGVEEPLDYANVSAGLTSGEITAIPIGGCRLMVWHTRLNSLSGSGARWTRAVSAGFGHPPPIRGTGYLCSTGRLSGHIASPTRTPMARFPRGGRLTTSVGIQHVSGPATSERWYISRTCDIRPGHGETTQAATGASREPVISGRLNSNTKASA